MTATSRTGLAPRILASVGVVVLAAAATAWIVAMSVGPGIFHDHLSRSGVAETTVALHAEEAFRTASATALTLALITALAAAIIVSSFLASRISRSLAVLVRATEHVADGHYATRVPRAGLGIEFDHMVDAFNEMAAQLDAIEATRTRILADLAHELRTPVATLDAYLEAMVDGVEQPTRNTLTMLREQTWRLARLAEDVTLVTTAEEGRLESIMRDIDASTLLESVKAQFKDRYAARGVALALMSSLPRHTTVVADSDRLGQVLTNLIDNALRHTPAGGSVTISARLDSEVLVIDVSDDGDGIPPEHLTHVFERFYRVDAARDRAHGGSGIGLAIAKAIVTEHGGTIGASSLGSGQGTTITIRLPR